MDIPQVWQGLTQGQGTVIAGLITLIAALGGVVLGWLLFSGRVRSLETALSVTESNVRSHLQRVEGALAEYKSKLNVQLASLSQQLGQLSGSVADIPTSTPEAVGAVQQYAQDNQDNMRENWGRIRNRLEEIAANPQIDGRTRAKYDRIDRRQYGDLVNALHSDGLLRADTTFYRNAIELWQRFRTGRGAPSAGDVQKMRDLANRLTEASTP